MQFTDEQIKLYEKIAEKFNLTKRQPHCSSGKKYFQIYPNSTPVSEGMGGTHYEFWINENSIYLVMHVEKRTLNGNELKRQLKEHYTNLNTRGIYKKDITNLSDGEIIKKFEFLYNQYESIIENFYENMDNNIETKLKQPINQILYGPPGTGKTYNTINMALNIIDGEVSQDRSKAKERFEELSQVGQIEFVTFHQSYGYEEFVEGIKADSTEGNISYKIEDGIFKKLCKKSLKIITSDNEVSFDEAYNKYIQTINNKKLLKTKSGSIFGIEVNARENLNLLTGQSLQKNGSIIKEKLQEYILYDVVTDWSSYLPIVGEEIKQFMKVIETDNNKKYILIIDEINRGNISKIFGELITLIEPSKRIGADEEIKVKLPYSNEEFGVPKNLYIIGTMNTADRSIALLDTALRRRFEFVEMMPDSSLIDFEVDGINIKELLEKINQRVEYLYDREHTIGHAYLMELKNNPTLINLNNIFKNKIIPLLAEYFYDDWEKILLVLNDGFIEKIEQNVTKIFDDSESEYLEDEKFLYNVKNDFIKEAYIKIYKRVKDDNN